MEVGAVAPPPLPPEPTSPTALPTPSRARARSTGERMRANRSSSRIIDGPTPKYNDDAAEAVLRADKTAVKVAVRVRPPINAQDPGFDLIPQRFRESTCEVPTPTSLVVQSQPGKKHFIFDRVFDADTTQQSAWEYVSDCVPSFVQGYNVSILAYGQSGAGKSYTMGTSGPQEQNDTELMGIVPRAAQALFEKLNSSQLRPASAMRAPKRYSTQALPTMSSVSSERNWTLKATYVEIYNEQLRDLLVPESVPQSDRANVAIREDTKGRILLTGLTQVEINSVDDLLRALNFGSTIRQTDATAINARSSRSHAVFSLNLIQKKSEPVTSKLDKRRSMPAEAFHQAQAQAQAESIVTIDSKLHFVDLAGSERLKNTGATGERAKEGISINAGLASLGKVISQLSAKHGVPHVSYRDSRLTRLLQDSLGGNAITYMVACINPASFHMNETLNTVHYAQRARNIQSKPEIQQTSDDGDKQAAIDKLRAEVSFLRDQIRHSEHGDRTSRIQGDRVDKSARRDTNLNMQLMDLQESYNSLNHRHTKLLQEISRAKDEDADLPMLKEAIGDNAIERLNRSNSFAEAVEAVVLEYEKTIKSLETNLSKARENLAASEDDLLDKQSKLAYMDSIQQQLHARVQKSMDRESNNEFYLRDLESRLDGSATGEEKNASLIAELQKELGRLREGGNSAEEYITTLEERLAEAEQDSEIMQGEIDRLEHVVERQRSMGRLDNLLSELDSVRHSAQLAQSRAAQPAVKINGHRDSYDPFRPSSPGGGSSIYQTDDEFTDAPADQPADDETVVDDATTPITALPVPKKQHAEARSLAQNDFMGDKLENLTMELFDLRSEHESVITDFDNLQQKYQTALETLAKLEYDKEVPKPVFLAPATSRAAEAETADVADHTGVDGVVPETSRDVVEDGEDQDTLRREYQILSDRHQATLEQVEDLKLEVQRAVSMRPVSPNIGSGAFTALHRRKSGDALASLLSNNNNGNDRASKSFTYLKTIASNNLERDPEAKQSFDNNLNTVMTELTSQKEISTVLEAELNSVKKDMEAKQAIIAGLTRERSSLQAGSGVDFTVVGQLRDQLEESESQIRALHEQHSAREVELKQQIAVFKEKLDIAAKPSPIPSDNDMPGGFPATPGLEGPQADLDRREADREHIAHLQTELMEWETRHNAAMEAMKSSEARLLNTIADLEDSISATPGARSPSARSPVIDGDLSAAATAAAASFSAERAKHKAVVDALQREVEQHRSVSTEHAGKMEQLEKSYNSILSQVDEDSKSKDLSSKELAAHKDLVTNLESQLQVHKSAVAIHKESLESLQSAHSRELEELKNAMEAAEHESNERYSLLEQQHKTVAGHLQDELTKSQSEHQGLLAAASSVLGSKTDVSTLPEQIRGLVGEGKELHTRHLKATSDLKSVQEELQTAMTNTVSLENKIAELKTLHDEQNDTITKLVEKEHKSSRLIEELEEQLNNNFDSHVSATHRLSKMETETSQVRQEIERELEDQKLKVMVLEQQLAQARRQSMVSDRNSMNFNRESLSPEAAAFALARSASSSSNVRKSTVITALPSAPPSIPLPPLPASTGNSPAIGVNGADVSPMQSPMESTPTDLHASHLIEEQEARIRTIEKHLFAEKQLTATLEEALVDLETSANRTKSEADSWRKRCSSLEDELVSLRKEKTNSRASLQAVEEEREMRVRAERARQALEQRMMELNNAKKKKKNALNCF